ncbi:NAD-dependent epimerase/dehydratase family protein [Rhodococcoides fascians]|uniref:NAD-dependent epimerase/dehydratase family protein n=1 Tax=Rhodococcoides fascians TaxID=1828 RepID=UPI0024B966B5|nr:NAD-dependent epimerase/dehydratase family protein [Rhodococcus fascians]MDJ0467307.1 GDP-mannose 4,6-dehydratase [Rhodococcus fascians]
MKSVVTGAAGFVGSTLANRLSEIGHDVIGVDVFTNYYDSGIKKNNRQGLDPSVNFVEADLNTMDLDDLLDGVDYVFHQAGQPGVRSSWGSDFGIYTEMNILATQRLLEAAGRSASIRKFVYASSSSVYGDAEHYPTDELARPMPRSPYGVTKLAAEHLCTLYAKNFNVPTVSLRYFTVYGPRQRPDMAFNKFISAATDESALEVYGDGHQVRDFTYIDDVVAANISAALQSTEPGDVFNVSGGSNVSVREVIAILSGLAGKELDVAFGEPVPGDVRRTGGNAVKIREVLGWSPSVGIKEGLKRQWEYQTGKPAPGSGE